MMNLLEKMMAGESCDIMNNRIHWSYHIYDPF